ncbi:MAG: T9SS type A sorting domain-containing protein, partial [Phaeodactylibacter sp.]|nr:T9SS type A sorting domain-containing protein [Phaeodactylibacter sp.]
LETQGATCGGFADGAIEITVTGGTGNLNYEWDNGAGQEEDPSGLVSGVYNVIVSDANQCTITASATVQDATGLTLAINTVSAVSCFGAADGAVDITASGGAGMLSYAWSGGAGAVEDPAGLPPGAYIVTVTDENNCTRTDTAFVEEPPAITIVVDSLVSPACFGDEGGAILITAAGGAGQLSYAWNNGLGIAEDPMGVLAGAYTVTVADGNGCTAEETVTLTQPPALNFGAIEVTDATCPGFADGAVDVSVTGGSGVLTYQWSAGADTVEDPQGLLPGAYSVTVTDENGCSIGTSVLVEGLPPVVPEITGPTTLCMGSSTILDAGFGYATYQWSNGEQGQTIEVDEPNAYSVTVTSEAGCSGADGVLVEEVESLEVEIQGASFFCAGTSTTLDAGEYDSYLWSSGQMGRLAMINAPGLYAVTVTDESGCMGADSIEVAQAPAVDVGLDEVQHISCFGLEDGAIIATASGGAGQLLFEWSQGLGGSENLMNLGPGDYNLTVTDENGCFGQLFVTIQEPDSLQVEMASTDATSPAGNDGTATAIPQGGVSSYTYQWSNGGSTPTITGLEPGVYEVTVTDRNGCQAFGAAAVKLIVSSEELAFLRSEVELFPNPASQKVYLRYSSPAHLEIEWSILDLFGRQLQQGLAAESRKAHEIDISQLPKGVYFIRLRLEGAYFSRRLAVQ